MEQAEALRCKLLEDAQIVFTTLNSSGQVRCVLQCVAVCCSVQQCAAVVLQWVAVCCRVLQIQLQSCSRTPRLSLPSSQTESSSYHKLCRLSTTKSIVCDSSVLQCVAVFCSVLQWVAMCCSESALLCQDHELYRLGKIKERGQIYDRIKGRGQLDDRIKKKKGSHMIEFALSSATFCSVLQRVGNSMIEIELYRLQRVAACCSVLAIR